MRGPVRPPVFRRALLAHALPASAGSPQAVAWVFVGGALGSLLRHGLLQLAPPGTAGTLAANVLGSFVLGWLLRTLEHRGGSGPDVDPRTESLRLFAGTGVLGGFTTYSALAAQVVALGAAGTLPAAAVAAALGIGSVLLGVLAALVGWRVAGRRGPAPSRAEPAGGPS